MNAPKVGQRVRLIRPYYYDPQGAIYVGATGMVIRVPKALVGKGWICIKLDPKHIPKKNPPENGVISFYPDCGPLLFNGQDVEDVCLQFHLTCEYI